MKNKFLLIFLFLFAGAQAQVSSSGSELPENIDVKLFRAINSFRSPFLSGVIRFNDRSVLPNAIVAPLGLFTISRINKNYYDENSAILLGGSEAVAMGVSYGIKQIIQKNRPHKSLKNVYYELDNSPTDRYSFPSIHTATAFSMATSLTLRYNDKPALIAGVYTYAFLVGYGRVYLGVHYPSDVLMGAAIGAGSSILMFSLRKEFIKLKSNVFNEEYSDEKGEGVNEFVAIGGLLGVNIINDLLASTKVSVLKKTSLSTDLSSLSLKINF